ncbi:MAG: 2-oxoacid:acceptor oxidoreductase family protein [Candidatus Methanoperedens sp.]|nr:2-oxoacid:acceptor oxidoreductase family protein [Candidatus Methanoperedens sp.]
MRVEDREIFSQAKEVNVLIALNKETIFLHKDELSNGGGIIYDSAETMERKDIREDIRLYPVPFINIIKEIGAQPIMKNNLALGASIALIDYDFEMLAGDVCFRKVAGMGRANTHRRVLQGAFTYV